MSRRKRLSQQRKSGSPRKQQNVPEMTKYPCGHCEKEVKDQKKSMECDYCNKWYHITCESIKSADYDKLTTLKSLDQLHWYCKRCNPKCTDVLKLVAEISEREKSLAEQVQIYIDKVASIAIKSNQFYLDTAYLTNDSGVFTIKK